jgi:hypothetical protein
VKYLSGRRRLRTRTSGDGRWTKAQPFLARVLVPIAFLSLSVRWVCGHRIGKIAGVTWLRWPG